jgi:cobalt-zinc-cadmium efflux system outer membrane protein
VPNTAPRAVAVTSARILVLLVVSISAVAAQDARPVTRAGAVEAAGARGARLAIARADTLAAAAQLRTARQWQNPALAFSYSKSVPQYHYALELPLDLWYQRGPRVGAASAAQRAARFRYAYELAAVAMEADTAYTRALAARALAELSARNARDADSLRRTAITRRDAGDASDMDVALASVTAGQAANQATSDSLAYVSALLDLQIVMGMDAGPPLVTLADSLTPPPEAMSPIPAAMDVAPALPVAAAAARLDAATLALKLERRSVLGAPSLVAGFEEGDPSGGEPGRLPTFGIALPIPLLNRNRGPIEFARAEELRARAELALAEIETRSGLARAERQYAAATAKVSRSAGVLEQATRLATMALLAYREGAASLPNVLEAQRTARGLEAQYVSDVADAWIAAAELRIRTLTAAPSAP